MALSLPLLDAMQPLRGQDKTAEEPKRRMVLMDLAFGLHGPNLFPKKSGPNYESTPYLDVLKDLRNDLTVISGTSHPEVGGGHQAAISFLTAAPRPQSTGFKNTISVDQLAAEHIGLETRFSSMTLSTSPWKGLSYARNGVELPAESRASQLFARMFLEGNAEEKRKQLQRLKDGQSVMDSVLDSARAMKGRLGARDRDKLDQYFTAVQSAEQRLIKAETWQERPKPRVNVMPPQDIANGSDIIGRARSLLDMVHLALTTDSTRLVSFYSAGFNVVPQIPGVTQDYHNLSHHGQDPARLAELKIIELEFMKLYAEFLKKLRDTKEQGGTLLDGTMVMLGSELGNASSHDNHNLPILLAGGGFKHGEHLAFDPKNNYPLPNLYVTMLQRLGLEIDKFATSTGTMSRLRT